MKILKYYLAVIYIIACLVNTSQLIINNDADERISSAIVLSCICIPTLYYIINV